jgi:uncharacterized protein YndB with AHSA1/START domain
MTATLDTDGTTSTLRFERRLGHDPERVWRAVTEPDELRAWFPAAVIYEQHVGAPMQFDFGGEHGQDVWPGEVLEWDPPSVFAFAWGEDILRFAISPADDGTLLVFTHRFEHEPGKPARDAAGWEACFAAFDALLAGDSMHPGNAEWSAYSERYAERFGELTVDERRVRLAGPAHERDGHTAINVIVDGEPGVLIVREAGRPLADGAAVEIRRGDVDAPGEPVAEGVLRDPIAIRA